MQFEIGPTRGTVTAWLAQARLPPGDYPFPSRMSGSPHLSVRQNARLLRGWVDEIGLDPVIYGTHSLRRTKPTLIYRGTRKLRAVQLWLGHTKIESTVRYLGVEVVKNPRLRRTAGCGRGGRSVRGHSAADCPP